MGLPRFEPKFIELKSFKKGIRLIEKKREFSGGCAFVLACSTL